jgi:MIP family channel proteins
MASRPGFDIGASDLTSPAALKASFAEFIATTLFLFIGVGSVAAFISASGPNTSLVDGVPMIALAFGLAIAFLAAGIGPISGGHINPAVTFAMIITGHTSVVRGLMYIIAQLAGACLGVALLRAFLADEVILAIPGAGGNSINAQVITGNLQAIGVEAVGTFILVWTVFAVAVSHRSKSETVAPLYIGLAVLIAHIILVPLTGCGINPARSFGPALVNGRWEDQWVYWVGPLIGAALAGLIYTYLYLMDDQDQSIAAA